MTFTGHQEPRMTTTHCAGCGHKLSKHREYANGGKNSLGCTLVCTVNGCDMWAYCRETAEEPK